jgi:hypothetical protein
VSTYDDYPTSDDPPTWRRWLIVLPTAIVVLLGVGWSGFWYWSSSTAEATMATWRAREAEAGRVYGCANTSFGGYPFRIEVTCTEPSVDDRATEQSIRARTLTAVAQVWDPTLVIGEIVGPLTVAPLGGAPTATIDWALAQASLRGTPGTPERLSIVLDKPSLASAPSTAALAKAEHMEFHGRFAAESTPGHPALDLALDLKSVTVPALTALLGTFGPMASASSDFSLVSVLHGAPDLALKPLAQRLREIQAANGRLDIANARLQQGDLTATATGALGLTARGTLTGELRLTVANFAKLIPMLGIDRAVAQFVPPDAVNRYAPALDRLMPGLGNVLRGGNAPAGGGGAKPDAKTALAGAALGGQQTELDGKPAMTLTLRFDDGVAFLGPLKLGQVPPLY